MSNEKANPSPAAPESKVVERTADSIIAGWKSIGDCAPNLLAYARELEERLSRQQEEIVRMADNQFTDEDRRALEATIERLQQKADAKYQAVAKAVFDTVKDRAATWDTACDELIWGNYDTEGPEHQPVTDAHLNECCARFPQWADELRPFAERWNAPESRLTDEELASIEVSEEEVQRSTRSALRVLKWADRIRAAENALRKALAAIEAEPEMPGRMPPEMWQQLRVFVLSDDCEGMAEAMRIVVRETKNGIRERVRALAASGTHKS